MRKYPWRERKGELEVEKESRGRAVKKGIRGVGEGEGELRRIERRMREETEKDIKRRGDR